MNMIFNDDDIRIHQSWLDNANRCPEAGRLAITRPDRGGPSDATALGTAAHAGVEAVLEGMNNIQGVRHRIMNVLDAELSHPLIKHNKYEGRADLLRRANQGFDEWHKVIYPMLPHVGTPEVNFLVEIGTASDGRPIKIEGQIDFVPRDEPTLWDWKFPGRRYSHSEKAMWAVQPTVYTMAAVYGGLAHVSNVEYQWPMKFTYGCVTTQKTRGKAQVFTVERNANHAAWITERILDWVNLALSYGLDNRWPRNDEHYLCSDKWCDFYADCKGQHLSWRDGWVPVEMRVK